MARLSSRAHPSARPVEVAGPSGTDGLAVTPNNPGTLSLEDHAPQWVLCNEDRLSNYSESSSITSPIVSDDDDDGSTFGLDESETESDEDWEDELEGDPNRGQNLRFRLQAAAAGVMPLFFSLE